MIISTLLNKYHHTAKWTFRTCFPWEHTWASSLHFYLLSDKYWYDLPSCARTFFFNFSYGKHINIKIWSENIPGKHKTAEKKTSWADDRWRNKITLLRKKSGFYCILWLQSQRAVSEKWEAHWSEQRGFGWWSFLWITRATWHYTEKKKS